MVTIIILNTTALTMLATKKQQQQQQQKKTDLFMSSSLYIEFHELYWSIIPSNTFNIADPDLYVISCGGGQLYVEPWW